MTPELGCIVQLTVTPCEVGNSVLNGLLDDILKDYNELSVSHAASL